MSENTQSPDYHIPIVALLNGFVRRIAETTAWLNVLLIGVIVVQVVMRYGFNRPAIPDIQGPEGLQGRDPANGLNGHRRIFQAGQHQGLSKR